VNPSWRHSVKQTQKLSCGGVAAQKKGGGGEGDYLARGFAKTEKKPRRKWGSQVNPVPGPRQALHGDTENYRNKENGPRVKGKGELCPAGAKERGLGGGCRGEGIFMHRYWGGIVWGWTKTLGGNQEKRGEEQKLPWVSRGEKKTKGRKEGRVDPRSATGLFRSPHSPD